MTENLSVIRVEPSKPRRKRTAKPYTPISRSIAPRSSEVLCSLEKTLTNATMTKLADAIKFDLDHRFTDGVKHGEWLQAAVIERLLLENRALRRKLESRSPQPEDEMISQLSSYLQHIGKFDSQPPSPHTSDEDALDDELIALIG